jgi:hypothetical protein
MPDGTLASHAELEGPRSDAEWRMEVAALHLGTAELRPTDRRGPPASARSSTRFSTTPTARSRSSPPARFRKILMKTIDDFAVAGLRVLWFPGEGVEESGPPVHTHD